MATDGEARPGRLGAPDSERFRQAMDQVVIANRLSDGLVVFLAAAPGARRGEWRLRLAEASVASDPARAEELLALGTASAKQDQQVVEPYLIEVRQTAQGLEPTVYREKIRCLGPTVRADLGKQAEGREVR